MPKEKPACSTCVVSLLELYGYIKKIRRYVVDKDWKGVEQSIDYASSEFRRLDDEGCLYYVERNEMADYFKKLRDAVKNRDPLEAYHFVVNMDYLTFEIAKRLFKEKLCECSL